MEQAGREKSKGVARNGRQGGQPRAGRANAKSGSQRDDDMEAVGSLFKKCLNPMTEGTRSGRTTNFLSLLSTAEDLQAMTAGGASGAMEMARCVFLCSYLRRTGATEVLLRLGITEEGMPQAHDLDLDPTWTPEQEKEIHDIISPKLQAANDVVKGSLAAEMGKYVTKIQARRVRMQVASDGSRIQYDQGKIQNLMLHGVNVNDPAELVPILASAGLRPGFQHDWIMDSSDLKVSQERHPNFGGFCRLPTYRASLIVQMDENCKRFLERVYVAQDPVADHSPAAGGGSTASAVSAIACLGQDDGIWVHFALEMESREGAQQFQDAMDWLYMMGFTEQQVLDVILWQLHADGLIAAEILPDEGRSIFELFNPQRVLMGARSRRGRLHIRLGSNKGQRAVQKLLLEDNWDGHVTNIDYREYVKALLPQDAAQGLDTHAGTSLLQIPAPFRMVVRNVSRITEREGRSGASIVLRPVTPTGTTLAVLLQGVVMSDASGTGVAARGQGLTEVTAGIEAHIAASTQLFLDSHVRKLAEDGSLVTGHAPRVSVEITRGEDQSIGSGSRIIILLNEKPPGATDTAQAMPDYDVNVVLCACQLGVLIANRAEALPLSVLRWDPLAGACSPSPICSLDRITIPPEHGTCFGKGRGWIDLCAESNSRNSGGGAQGTLSFRAMKNSTLLRSIVAVMLDEKLPPAAANIIRLATSGSSQLRNNSQAQAVLDKPGPRPKLILGMPQPIPSAWSSSMWVTHFTHTQSVLQVPILQFLGVPAQHYAASLYNMANGQEGYHSFKGLEEFANTLSPAWTIPFGAGLPPICSECRQPYTLGTDRGYTPVDPSAARPDIARLHPEWIVGIKAALGEAHNAFTREARNGVWGCQHCVHCIDQGIAKQVRANAASVMDQSSASKDALEQAASRAAEATMHTILAHLLLLRRYPAKKGPWKLALMPPPPQEDDQGPGPEDGGPTGKQEAPSQSMDMSVESKTQQSPTPSAAQNNNHRQVMIHGGTQMQLGHWGIGSGMSPRKIVLNEPGPQRVLEGPVSCDPVHGRGTTLPSLIVEDMGKGRLEGCRAGSGPEPDACIEVGTPLTPIGGICSLDSALKHHEQKLPGQGADLDRLRVTQGGIGPQVSKAEMSWAKHAPVGSLGGPPMKIDDGRPCGRAGALDAAPSQSGDNGQGQGQHDTMGVEEMTCPCPIHDGQPYVRTTVRDEVLHYLGLSAHTARPPGLPKSPPPCKGRRQQ